MEVIGGLNYLRVNRPSIESDPIGFDQSSLTPLVFAIGFDPIGLTPLVLPLVPQVLLGHNDLETTMIYTHVLNQGGQGVVSPLDDLGL